MNCTTAAGQKTSMMKPANNLLARLFSHGIEDCTPISFLCQYFFLLFFCNCGFPKISENNLRRKSSKKENQKIQLVLNYKLYFVNGLFIFLCNKKTEKDVTYREPFLYILVIVFLESLSGAA